MAKKIRFSEFWHAYISVLKLTLRPVLWIPLGLQAGVAICLALAHYYIFSPVTGPLVHGWASLFEVEVAKALVHYPGHFIVLPYLFEHSVLIFNIFAEAFLFGIFLSLLVGIYRGSPYSLGGSFKDSAGKYLKLAATWAILYIILYVVGRYFFDFVENVLGYSMEVAPRRKALVTLILHGLRILILAPSVFLLPSIIIGGVSFGAAIRRGLSFFTSHPFASLGLVLVPYFIWTPLPLALAFPAKLVQIFNPEMVFYLVIGSIFANFVANFIFLGTSLKLYLDYSE